jgi:dihydroorotase
MAKSILISDANIVNEGTIFRGDVLIEEGRIRSVSPGIRHPACDTRIIEARGKFLMPGVIDDQVHFRDPGLTRKGDLHSESRAAVAGGVTSFMDMPNTDPQTISLQLLEEKCNLAATKSLANYAFFLGATNGNLDEIRKADPSKVCGVKVFMGASTGNMLVDDPAVLEAIFAGSPVIVAIHAEDEPTIRENLGRFKEQYGDNIPVEAHPLIRSERACFLASEKAVGLALKHNARLHILHLSTLKETDLLDNDLPLSGKRITAEVCVHHLWFNDSNYAEFGSRIKWNPSIKTEKDQKGLLRALLSDKIDLVATDHAPHLAAEKKNPYTSCPSGGPLIQHSLVAMLELCSQGKISVEKVVQKMCHNPAILYRIRERGFIREGYFADLVLVDPNAPWTVTPENILYKCGWSPFEGVTFSSRVIQTFVNGHLVYDNGTFRESHKGERLLFYA